MKMNRIQKRFDQLRKEKRAGLVAFITASDPDFMTSECILNALPAQGADFIELGMPFSDPMADGPVIQAANRRALSVGGGLESALKLVKSFRSTDSQTPVILMGYFNPIYSYGTARFAVEAAEAGIDGVIVVDLPPEEDEELYVPARKAGLDVIRLVAPTTSDERLQKILTRSSGFLYYVSIAGVTGTARPDPEKISKHLHRVREKTTLPLAIGFGIKTPEDVKAMAKVADAVVVGSQIVRQVQEAPDKEAVKDAVGVTVRALAAGLKS